MLKISLILICSLLFSPIFLLLFFFYLPKGKKQVPPDEEQEIVVKKDLNYYVKCFFKKLLGLK
jgi:hypothetical protein